MFFHGFFFSWKKNVFSGKNVFFSWKNKILATESRCLLEFHRALRHFVPFEMGCWSFAKGLRYHSVDFLRSCAVWEAKASLRWFTI